MELTWTDLDTGAITQGREEVYLIITDLSVLASDVTEVRVTRWRTGAEDACWQALRNAVIFPLRPAPAVVSVEAMVRSLRADCQRYENGERVDWVLRHPAWRRPITVPGSSWENVPPETRAFFDALHGSELSEGL